MIKRIILICAIILSVATGAFAQNSCPGFIEEGYTATATQELFGNQECINYGTIRGGDQDNGVIFYGHDNLFINEGTIYAIEKGITIPAFVDFAEIDETFNRVINNGLITNELDYGESFFYGIFTGPRNPVHIINNGQIIAFGADVHGISVHDDSFIINNGDIFLSDLEGVSIVDPDKTHSTIGLYGVNRDHVTNMGHVRVIGSQWSLAYGNYYGDDATLINGGILEAQPFDGIMNWNDVWEGNNDPFAIWIGSWLTHVDKPKPSENFKIYLLPTSIIMGKIGLGASHVDPTENDGNPLTNDHTLDISNGLSVALTFEKIIWENGRGFIPGNIESNGALVSVNYDDFMVATVDTTLFSVVDEIAIDLSNNIKNSLYSHIYHDRKTRQAWGSTFGGYRDQPGNSPNFDTKIYNAGIIGGMDWSDGAGVQYGLYMGGTYNKVNHQLGNQSLEVQGGYTGGYLTHKMDAFTFGIIGSVGLLDHDGERNVANNQNMETGIDEVEADYLGTFFMSEISVSMAIPIIPGFLINPSFHLGYSGILTESFKETGSIDNFQVDNRNIVNFNARAQVEAYFKIDKSVFWGKAGIQVIKRVGGSSVSGSLVGTNFDFDLGAKKMTFEGILGGGWDYKISETITLTGKTEALFVNDGSIAANGGLSIKWSF